MSKCELIYKAKSQESIIHLHRLTVYLCMVGTLLCIDVVIFDVQVSGIQFVFNSKWKLKKKEERFNTHLNGEGQF